LKFTKFIIIIFFANSTVAEEDKVKTNCHCTVE